MVDTLSTMVQLGAPAPNFSLENPRTGGKDGFQSVRGERGTLVMFICNHCPFVVHIRARLLEVAADAQTKGIGVIAVNANNEESHPQDGPRHMKSLAEKEDWSFPYVFDRTQEVARAYHAACTPDFFLFDGDAQLVYRGQFDDARPSSDEAVTGKDLVDAMDALCVGAPVSDQQRPSMGCSIKWARGNEPETV